MLRLYAPWPQPGPLCYYAPQWFAIDMTVHSNDPALRDSLPSLHRPKAAPKL
jgi:hypothetical protein